jgi:hypothetical protein
MSTELDGVVWLAQEIDLEGRPAGYFGYWDLSGGKGEPEEYGTFRDADEALAWGRARAPVILIRSAYSAYFSAGVETPPSEPEMEPWAGQPPEPVGPVDGTPSPPPTEPPERGSSWPSTEG